LCPYHSVVLAVAVSLVAVVVAIVGAVVVKTVHKILAFIENIHSGH